VKILILGKDSSDKESKKAAEDMRAEINLGKIFKHKNVVAFFGSFYCNGNLALANEFCNGGSVDSFLKDLKKEDIKAFQLVRMLQDAAAGVRYLHSLPVLHRDLAARNLLISKTGNELVVKLSDFGLSREGGKYGRTGLNGNPQRWSAPETMFGGKDTMFHYEATTKSDVWSFGVVIWEFFTFCKSEPYEGSPIRTLRGMFTDLNKDCDSLGPTLIGTNTDLPKEIRDIIVNCMKFEPPKRPTIEEVCKSLEGISGASLSGHVWSIEIEAPSEATPIKDGGYDDYGNNSAYEKQSNEEK